MSLLSLLHEYEQSPNGRTACAIADCYRQMREWEPALKYFTLAAGLDPLPAQAWTSCGDVLAAMGKPEEAKARYERAAALRPEDAETHLKLGRMCAVHNLNTEADRHLARCLTLTPRQTQAWGTLAVMYGRPNISCDALLDIIDSIVKVPDVGARLLGVAWGLCSLGRHRDAKTLTLRRLEQCPNSPAALFRLGDIEVCLGQMSEALHSYESAVAVASPPFCDIVFTYYLQHLIRISGIAAAKRAFQERIAGPRGYRMGCPGHPLAGWVEWSGQPLGGKTVLLPLLADEIGHGDAIQAARFAPQLAAEGASVIIECHRALQPLFSTAHGIARAVTGFTDLPPIDYYVPAGVAGLRLDPGGSCVPYLHPTQDRIAEWSRRLRTFRGLRVGLHSGSGPAKGADPDRHRAIPVQEFAPLAAIEGAKFFSLQFGAGAEAVAQAGFPLVDLEVGDFHDTAAAIANLDVVVSADGATAHLAGALGKTCLVCLPYTADWRWMLDHTESPFYPSLSLFRQVRSGDWSDPIRGVASRLMEIASARHFTAASAT